MRRNDREITRISEMTDVMKRCDVQTCTGMMRDGYPYLLPLNFGMEETDGRVTLYFHGAKEGKKYDLIRKDVRGKLRDGLLPQTGAVGERRWLPVHHGIRERDRSGNYRDPVGCGKQKALNLLMKQYYPDRTENFVFRPEVVAMTEIFCLKVEHMTGKKRFKNVVEDIFIDIPTG